MPVSHDHKQLHVIAPITDHITAMNMGYDDNVDCRGGDGRGMKIRGEEAMRKICFIVLLSGREVNDNRTFRPI